MKKKRENTNYYTEQFKEFYIQHAIDLIFYARKFVDEHTAEDLVHDIFLRIWDKKLMIIAEKDIKSYLLSMVKNACYDYLRHQEVEDIFFNKRIQQLKLDELNYYELSTDDPLDNEKIVAIFAAIEKLPPKSKNIFKKVYIEQQNNSDIAKELNISIRTVETHIYKALKLIRENLISFLVFMFLHVF